MAPNLPTTCLLSSPRSGTLIIIPAHQETPGAMVNGQAEAAMKIVKGLLSKAKYSGQDLHLALLAYRSTPIDAHLQSPAEMLYQRNIHTTLPQRIHHKDPMLQMTMTDSTNVLPRVLNTTTITAEPSPHCMQGKLYLSSTMTRASGSLLKSSIKLTMAHTLYRL